MSRKIFHIFSWQKAWVPESLMFGPKGYRSHLHTPAALLCLLTTALTHTHAHTHTTKVSAFLRMGKNPVIRRIYLQAHRGRAERWKENIKNLQWHRQLCAKDTKHRSIMFIYLHWVLRCRLKIVVWRLSQGLLSSEITLRKILWHSIQQSGINTRATTNKYFWNLFLAKICSIY